MTRAFRRIPDFAGVALVDILANGTAMLIIIIVVSLAARMEREERQAEQADDVATVMIHRFSTSLVLNSLAATPARLIRVSEREEFKALPQDPILELHREVVRELDTGTTWTRRELLECSGLSDWLKGLKAEQRARRLQIHIYDIPQFYLVMSILRDHDIRPRVTKWRSHSLTEAERRPSRVAEKDCPRGDPEPEGEGNPDEPKQEAGPDGRVDSIAAVNSTAAYEARRESPGNRKESLSRDPVPTGAMPRIERRKPDGGGALGDGPERNRGLGTGRGDGANNSETFEIFPHALGGGRDANKFGRARDRDADHKGRDEGSGGPQIRFEIPRDAPSLEKMFGVTLHYLGDLQSTLDTGGSPSVRAASFPSWLPRAMQEPPRLTEDEQRIAHDLSKAVVLMRKQGDPDPLTISSTALGPNEDSVLIVEPNRLIHIAEVGRSEVDDQSPNSVRATFKVNIHPAMWKGPDIDLEPGSVLLLPPGARETEGLRWRAVAYFAPSLDDLIVGFVFAEVNRAGRLRIEADANRVRIAGQPLVSHYQESGFGARGWLVSLYAALAAGFMLFGLAWGLFAVRLA